MNIAVKYLLPKQIKATGLKEGELSVSEAAIRDIVRYYTREAGVRAMERELSKICRKAVKQLLTEKQAGEAKAHRITVTPKNLDKYLGVRRYTFGMAEKQNQVGQVTGLAWTEVGGELLTIEAVTMPGKGKTITTGKLGEVMQESIQAALSVVRNRSSKLGVAEDFYQKNDIHVHLPEGATPKDGPSAGRKRARPRRTHRRFRRPPTTKLPRRWSLTRLVQRGANRAARSSAGISKDSSSAPASKKLARVLPSKKIATRQPRTLDTVL